MVFSMIPALPAATASASADQQAASGSGSQQAGAEASASRAEDAADTDIVVSGADEYGEVDMENGEFAYSAPEVTHPGKRLASSSMPSKYDLRSLGRVTSVKDQDSRGFCWAFASIASVESNLITKGLASKSLDLSEAHLAYFAFHGKSSKVSRFAGRDTCYSQNDLTHFYTPGATLTRGYGAVSESAMPYSTLLEGYEPPAKYTTEANMTRSTYEVDKVIYISANTTAEKYDAAAVSTVKQLLMKSGAVASKMYFPESYEWKAAFGTTKPNELEAYYSAEEYPNHAITIVGWDDGFDDFKGTDQPPGPGAWIVKDSYGTEIHGDGYFYMSYYSPSMSQFLSFEAQKNTGREMYQYDGVGPGDNLLSTGSLIRGANRFTARSDLLIDQVSTFTPEAGCKINVKIYAERNGSAPGSGTLLFSKSFTQKYTGFARTSLGKKIGIPKGSKFSVVVTAKTPSGRYYIPFELQNIESKGCRPAPVSSGQSYMLIGGKWKAVSYSTTISADDESFRVFNATVKAFGKKAGTKAQKIKVKTTRKVKRGKTLKLKAKRTKGSGKLIYRSSNPKIATVSAKGVVKAKKKGSVKITVYALPTSSYKAAKKIVKIKVK